MAIIKREDYNFASPVVNDIVDFGAKGIRKYDGERWIKQDEVTIDGAGRLFIGEERVTIAAAELNEMRKVLIALAEKNAVDCETLKEIDSFINS